MSWASSESVRKSMRGNKRRDTKPELIVRSALHALGYRFRVDFRASPSIRTRADIVFTKRRVIVFIDGCFWHGCPTHGSRPKTNSDYWLPKLDRNIARDRATDATLASEGWVVLHFWEHEDLTTVVTSLTQALGSPRYEAAH
ncbi:very short patch repair endonuclease [Gryllotalpicola koreensis]|uniref:Very short patch repair endonuclease n=1 Tax=Gryllotalpicola koreensis TaxID=993086 RepID=A0ABP7ZTU9_9MICO